MCTADAILFYGVCVMAADLIFAARAWTEIEPALRAIELIQARRRRGALQTENGGRVTDAPTEIWEMIASELAVAKALQSECAFVASLHSCTHPNCACAPLEPDTPLEHLSECANCPVRLTECGGLPEYMTAERDVRCICSTFVT